MKTKTCLMIVMSLITLSSANLYAMSCPKSFEGIKNLSKEKRLKCTLYKVGILERYLDDQGGYEYSNEMAEIGELSKRLKGMESKIRGIMENYCIQGLGNNRAKSKACLAEWEKARR